MPRLVVDGLAAAEEGATMATATSRRKRLTSRQCGWCGGTTTDERALLDHEEWCLGDGRANVALLDEVARRDGQLTQEALVEEAHRRRLAATSALPPN